MISAKKALGTWWSGCWGDVLCMHIQLISCMPHSFPCGQRVELLPCSRIRCTCICTARLGWAPMIQHPTCRGEMSRWWKGRDMTGLRSGAWCDNPRLTYTALRVFALSWLSAFPIYGKAPECVSCLWLLDSRLIAGARLLLGKASLCTECFLRCHSEALGVCGLLWPMSDDVWRTTPPLEGPHAPTPGTQILQWHDIDAWVHLEINQNWGTEIRAILSHLTEHQAKPR